MKIALLLILVFGCMNIHGQKSLKNDFFINTKNHSRPSIQLGSSIAFGKPNLGISYDQANLGYTIGAIAAFNKNYGRRRIVTGFQYTSYEMYTDKIIDNLNETYAIQLIRPHFYDFPLEFDLGLPLAKWLDIHMGLATSFGALISKRGTYTAYNATTNEIIKEEPLSNQAKLQFAFGIGLNLGFQFYINDNYSVEIKGIANSRIVGGLFSGSFYEFQGGLLSLKRTIKRNEVD